MNIMARTFTILGAFSLLLCGAAMAHHSMSMYDRSRDTTFSATITGFDFANPHAQIIFTVTDGDGNAVTWTAEGPGPNRLAKNGWSGDSLKPGDQVTIVGNANRDGSHTMRFERVIFANGQTLEAYPRRS